MGVLDKQSKNGNWKDNGKLSNENGASTRELVTLMSKVDK
jgi:hypothetical protein